MSLSFPFRHNLQLVYLIKHCESCRRSTMEDIHQRLLLRCWITVRAMRGLPGDAAEPCVPGMAAPGSPPATLSTRTQPEPAWPLGTGQGCTSCKRPLRNPSESWSVQPKGQNDHCFSVIFYLKARRFDN